MERCPEEGELSRSETNLLIITEGIRAARIEARVEAQAEAQARSELEAQVQTLQEKVKAIESEMQTLKASQSEVQERLSRLERAQSPGSLLSLPLYVLVALVLLGVWLSHTLAR